MTLNERKQVNGRQEAHRPIYFGLGKPSRSGASLCVAPDRAKSQDQEPQLRSGQVAQPGAQGDAGLRFGLLSPSLVRPRPLARALGV